MLRKPLARECANPYCERRVKLSDNNKFGACHKCLEIILGVKWLIEEGVLSTDKTRESTVASMLWKPGDPIRRR